MAKNRGIQDFEEVDVSRIRRDSRPAWQKFIAWVKQPIPGMSFTATIALIVLVVPAVTIPVAFCTLFFCMFLIGGKKGLPIRLPLAADIDDPSQPVPNSNKFEKGEGIMYLGHNRSLQGNNEQVWISNSDARTHAFTLGTTGSGKTQALLSWAFNSLSWGSSFVYVDGKADVELIYKVYSMCRRLGREDDFYVVNFMTGDSDAFERTRTNDRFSNTINPLSSGSSNALTQLVSSLMPESGGDNAMWQGLAIGMINAVIIGLCYKRFKDGFTIDAGILRDHIELGALVDLTREFQGRKDVPQDLVFKPLKTYLLNLPGFDWKANLEGKGQVSEDTKKQHDFRSMQFLRQLTMLADTYGDVFNAEIPECDMLDVVLKRRIVVVAIPSLEKSEEESQGVGKLVISALKLMMAKTLGSSIEGSYDHSVQSRPTNSNSPFLAIMDELGYYFTKGMAVMAAQARSLGFSLWPAGQDLSALMKGANKEEAESVIANTKFKISLSLEDPNQTADMLIKTAGKAVISEVAGYEGKIGAIASANYKDNLNASIQVRERLTLEELRDMESGQSILMWRDKIVRMQNFYIFAGPGSIKQSKHHNLNRLLACFPPGFSEIEDLAELVQETAVSPHRKITSMLLSEDLLVSYSGGVDQKSTEILEVFEETVDFKESEGNSLIEAGFYYLLVDLCKFSLVEDGKVGKIRSEESDEKSSGKSSGKGPQLVPRAEPKEIAADNLQDGRSRPIVSSDRFVISLDDVFARDGVDGEGVVEYPVRPKVSKSALEMPLDEYDGKPVVSSSFMEIELDDEVQDHLSYLDTLLSGSEPSKENIKRDSLYKPNKGNSQDSFEDGRRKSSNPFGG